MFKFANETDDKTGQEFYKFANSLYSYVKKNLNFDNDVVVVKLVSDETNASDVLGKTAYYNPEAMEIVLYSNGRHLKDILRSFSHELVHHSQNCIGNLQGNEAAGEDGYAQNDSHLRNMEKEAYLKGNMLFRDWEDDLKNRRKQMSESKNKKNKIGALDPYMDLSVLKHKRDLRFQKTLQKFGIKCDLSKLKTNKELEEQE